MRSALAWVLGKGGLLGSHLAQAIAAGLPDTDYWDCITPKFVWADAPLLHTQLREAVGAFAKTVLEGYRSWMVLWAAGAGVVGSTEPALEAEAKAWGFLLQLLGEHFDVNSDRLSGTVFLASSAGGVYGESSEQPFTEASRCLPISAYGRNKLLQEQVLETWASSRPHIAYLIGRISNIYGPGQNLKKPQGVISQISCRLIYHCPVRLYVPLDTIRDYIFIDDCAKAIVQCLASLACIRRGAWSVECETSSHAARPTLHAPRGLVKIFAAEQATSLAQIVSIFSRIAAKRHPKLLRISTPTSNEQPRRLGFRSIVWPNLAGLTKTPLSVGINRVHQHLLDLYRQGRLLPP